MNIFIPGRSRWRCRSPLLLVTVLAALLASSETVTTQSIGLPDLIINRARLASRLLLQIRSFSGSECSVVEGCVSAGSQRALLLFEVSVANIGSGDLVVGNPTGRPDLFEFSPCHGHFHFSGLARYELISSSGRIVRVARKQSFCLRDVTPYLRSARRSRRFSCDFQGISAGWEDVYPRTLDCQWLDITDLPGGRYTLRVRANSEYRLAESNYLNNSVSVPVTIRRSRFVPSVYTIVQSASGF